MHEQRQILRAAAAAAAGKDYVAEPGVTLGVAAQTAYMRYARYSRCQYYFCTDARIRAIAHAHLCGKPAAVDQS